MTIGVAQFLRIYEGATTYGRWQNFWPTYTVDQYGFGVFEVASIDSTLGGAEVTTTVTFGFDAANRDLLMAAVAAGQLVEIKLYSFTPTADGSPPGSKTLYAQHEGQALQLSESSESMVLTVGDSLSPSRPQVPPRVYTTALVGVPCQL